MIVTKGFGMQPEAMRQIEGVDNHFELITGGALMGDGGIALILDPDKLFKTAA